VFVPGLVLLRAHLAWLGCEEPVLYEVTQYTVSLSLLCFSPSDPTLARAYLLIVANKHVPLSSSHEPHFLVYLALHFPVGAVVFE